MSSDEETITTLYLRRQNILKQLSEVNNEIRTAEQQINEKSNNNETRRVEELVVKFGGDDDRESYLLDFCMRDANGLREAIRYFDALKALKECTSDDEVNRKKHLSRNTFVHAMIARSGELMVDANGSELIQHALGMLKGGGKVAPVLYSTDYIAASESDLSEFLLLLEVLKDKIPQICCDTNGSRAMQKVFDSLKSLEEVEFSAQCFSECIIELCKDIDGNHAVSRLLAAARGTPLWESGAAGDDSSSKLAHIHQLLYGKFPESCVDVCGNRHGCCVIQKCLQWAPEPYFSTLMDTIVHDTIKLVHDPFGNYVIQFILDHEQELSQRSSTGSEGADYTNRIIRQMLHNVAALSCNKFCSNVIEKCLKSATPDVRQLLVDELTDPQILPKLLTDSFANYVIQTAIVTSTEEKQFTQLRDSIMPLQRMLKNSPHGVKVESKLVRQQRELARKNGNQKNKKRWAQPAPQVMEKGMHEGFIGTHILPGMAGIPTIVGTDEFGGPALSLPGVAKEAVPIMTPTQYMPLMLPGQQTLIGLPQGYPQQQFPMDIMKGGNIWDPQQGFTLLHHPESKKGT
ncbi:pumillo RNA binding protein PUF1 [Trypanosoma brucei equiperdum]|uniref:Pumillo RNA binding protein PUF1 n=1 Tax=Trypanosoma brucei equiperdum TaxID=630700 RepID=A0A3L6KYV5_9TRYP|nr:pumillo RNA binding protein PUF1 [Trypanosoma brucei equiperdum]